MSKSYEANIDEWDLIYDGKRVPPTPTVAGLNRFALSTSDPDDEYYVGSALRSGTETVPGNDDYDNFVRLRGITILDDTYISKNVRQTNVTNMTARDYAAYPTPTIDSIDVKYVPIANSSAEFYSVYSVRGFMPYGFRVTTSIYLDGVLYVEEDSICNEVVDGGNKYVSKKIEVKVADMGVLVRVDSKLTYHTHPYHGVSSGSASFTFSSFKDTTLYLEYEESYAQLPLLGGNIIKKVQAKNANKVIFTGFSSVVVDSTYNFRSGETVAVSVDALGVITFDMVILANTHDGMGEKMVAITATAGGTDFSAEMVFDQEELEISVVGSYVSAGTYVLLAGLPKEFKGKSVQYNIRHIDASGTLLNDHTAVSTVTSDARYPGATITAKLSVANVLGPISFMFVMQVPYDKYGNYVSTAFPNSSEFTQAYALRMEKKTNSMIGGGTNVDTVVYSFRDNNTIKVVMAGRVTPFNVTLATEDNPERVWVYPDQTIDVNDSWEYTINPKYSCSNITVYISERDAGHTPVSRLTFRANHYRDTHDMSVPATARYSLVDFHNYKLYALTYIPDALRHQFLIVRDYNNAVFANYDLYLSEPGESFMPSVYLGNPVPQGLVYSVRGVFEDGYGPWSYGRWILNGDKDEMWKDIDPHLPAQPAPNISCIDVYIDTVKTFEVVYHKASDTMDFSWDANVTAASYKVYLEDKDGNVVLLTDTTNLFLNGVSQPGGQGRWNSAYATLVDFETGLESARSAPIDVYFGAIPPVIASWTYNTVNEKFTVDIVTEVNNGTIIVIIDDSTNTTPSWAAPNAYGAHEFPLEIGNPFTSFGVYLHVRLLIGAVNGDTSLFAPAVYKNISVAKPANITTVTSTINAYNDVNSHWARPAGTYDYTFKVYLDGSLAHTIAGDGAVSTFTYVPTVTDLGKAFVLGVIAANPTGSSTEKKGNSILIPGSIAAPGYLSSTCVCDGGEDIKFNLSWDDVPGAVSYEVKFEGVDYGPITPSWYKLIDVYTPGDLGPYTWYVRAKDSEGTFSDWSSAASATGLNNHACD